MSASAPPSRRLTRSHPRSTKASQGQCRAYRQKQEGSQYSCQWLDGSLITNQCLQDNINSEVVGNAKFGNPQRRFRYSFTTQWPPTLLSTRRIVISMVRQASAQGVSLIAFHKTGLSGAEWDAHVQQELLPCLHKLDLIPGSSQHVAWHTKQNADADGSLPLSQRSAVIEVTLPSSERTESVSKCSEICKSPVLRELEQRTGIEYVLLPKCFSFFGEHNGLAVFDMDSTLIQQEVIDELARAIGKYDQVSAITEAAMRGEAPYTDFEASLRARVGLLKGVPTTIWDELKKSIITFTPGAKELTKALKAKGVKTAVLSGGFIPLARWVQSTLGLDYAYANHLVEQDGILTGELVPGQPIIHAEKKRELLMEIAEKEGISLDHTIAVGDGSNDLKMMEVAGLGIAFNAKPKVQAVAPVRLNSPTLLDVMYILGLSDQEINRLLW